MRSAAPQHDGTQDAVFEVIDAVFSATTRNVLRSSSRFAAANVWYLLSDYCLYDPNKSSSVISFVAVPELDDISPLAAIMKKLAPREFKRRRKFPAELSRFLLKVPIQSFAFFHDLHDRESSIPAIRIQQREFIRYLECRVKEILQERPDRDRSGFVESAKKLRIRLNKANYNWKLVSDVLLIPYLAAYISTVIHEWDNVQSVRWISDRDNIMSLANGFALFYYAECFHSLMDKRRIHKPHVTPTMGRPELFDTDPEFTELLKLPDYLSGVLSGFDPETTTSDSSKSYEGLRDWIVGNDKVLLYRAQYRSEQFRLSRVGLEKKTSKSDSLDTGDTSKR